MDNNPLASSQRESTGASTFDKYEFQYHWALCKILDEQKKLKEYALFMEYHEDVVISDSLNSTSAKFEFNQVKNIKSPKYNINNLTKCEKGKSSVLGKLITSVNKKPFEKQITTINLVASCGFNIDQVDNDKNLDIITIGDLSSDALEGLKKSLNVELGIANPPSNLCFVLPDLGIMNQQDAVIGRISKLVSHVFQGSFCGAENIYRALIDDLHRKGTVTFDYNNWSDLLEKKALTSTEVTDTINTHVDFPNLKEILMEAADISKELNFSYIKTKRLKQDIRRIHIDATGFPTSLNLKIRKSIQSLLLIELGITKELFNIVKNIFEAMSEELKKEIGSDDEIQAHILYEIIVG